MELLVSGGDIGPAAQPGRAGQARRHLGRRVHFSFSRDTALPRGFVCNQASIVLPASGGRSAQRTLV